MGWGEAPLEDIAEELVGDIRDEDDLGEPYPVQDADGSWLLPGRWRLDEIADATGVQLPDSDLYENVSGLVLAGLGRVANVGDEVTVDLPDTFDRDSQPTRAGQATLRVEQVRRRVPHAVRMSVDGGREDRP